MNEKQSGGPPSRKLLNARARGEALIALSRNHREEYRRLYLIYKREQYAHAGVPLGRRHVKHRDDGTGFCVACDQVFPCPAARRRVTQ